jgi:hypothetical protein
VAALEDKLVAVTFHAKARELVITRANLRIVNGLGHTNCTEDNGDSISNCPNGLGNLIVGYNEERGGGLDNRTGSHNVVVGTHHNFSRFGGIVVGLTHEISGDYASVSGGLNNTATGFASAISGGAGNTASGGLASVSGGDNNRADGNFAVVSGGVGNTANGLRAAVSGGSNRNAPDEHNWAAGRLFQAN